VLKEILNPEDYEKYKKSLPKKVKAQEDSALEGQPTTNIFELTSRRY